MNQLKAVKIVVFVLTFLLVFGTLAMLGTIYQKANKSKADTPSVSNLNEPYGSRIESFEVKNEKMYLLIKNGGRADRIVIINADTGRQNRLELNNE